MEHAEALAALCEAEQRARLRGGRLAATRLIEPYSQGELDGLCGLYAAVNALRLIAVGRRTPLSEEDAHTLFRCGADFVHKRGKLSAAVRHGLGWRLWVKLVAELTTKAGRMLGAEILLQQPFEGMADMAKLLFVSEVRTLIHDRKAVLVLLKGEYEHFTVISGLSDTRLRLFDSYGYSWITLAACSTSGEANVTRHRIHLPSLLVMGP